MRIVVIDDVKEARAGLLADIATHCPELDVIGEAEGVVSGAKLIKQTKPDLVFLDIMMQDGSGFDLLELVGDQIDKVVFTTACDDYAIKAFKYSAIDYLLKPIDVEELKEAVKKANKFEAEKQLSIYRDHDNQEKDKRIVLHSLDKIHVLFVKEIIRCESNGNYTLFHLKTGDQILVTKTLKEFDELLTPFNFFRIHQSHLINMNYLKEFIKADGGFAMMEDGAEVPVSSRKRPVLMSKLSEL